jgi:NADH dehydrogenase/NADH:ubiquinone oxidoreductase subunit G
MKAVSLTIDGKRIYAAAGTTILEAARKNGIEIPTLCYPPG